jgi:hypothetical protein
MFTHSVEGLQKRREREKERERERERVSPTMISQSFLILGEAEVTNADSSNLSSLFLEPTHENIIKYGFQYGLLCLHLEIITSYKSVYVRLLLWHFTFKFLTHMYFNVK